jgi:peptide/nickel transport system substrate-binding protein
MKRILALFTALLVIGLSLLGCSSGQTPSATTTTSPTSTVSTTVTTTSATTSPTQAPRSGGTLTMVLWASPSGTGGLPWELFGNDFLSSQHIIEPLLHVDGSGNIVPCLAESYQVASDLSSITFNLRHGVKFHDGSDFNAQVAKWNLDQTIASKTQPNWASVDVIDDYTIRLNLANWTNTIITGFDGAATWMVSEAAYDKNGEDWMRNNPVGTGPFKFVSFDRDVSYKAVKNPDYWMQGRPYLDGVDILYVGDTLTQKATLESGGTDVLQIEPAKTAADLKSEGFQEAVTVTSTFCLLPDTSHPDSPFANQEVREAVSYALDRAAIANAFSYGFWGPAYQIPAPSTNVYDPNQAPKRQLDIAQAKQLMADAGYPNGFDATLLVIPVGIDQNIPVAIQNNLAQIGIKIEINAPAAIPAFIQNSNSLSNVLILQPIFSGANWNGALSFALNPVVRMMNQVWGITPEYTNLYNASLSAPTMDISLIRAVINYLDDQASVIPVFYGGSGYAYYSYVMDGGWNNRAGGWIPEDTWLNK